MSNARFAADAALIAVDRFDRGAIDRRTFLAALGGLGLTAMFRPGPAHAEANEIVICNWGGVATEAFQKAYGDYFTKQSGMKVSIDGAGPVIGAIRAMVESKKVTWDVTDGGLVDAAVLGKGGYVEPIDYGVVDKSKVAEGLAAEFGVANYIFANVLAYDSSKTNGAVPTWVDFFDLQKYPGKRAMCKWIQGQLECVLLADGVKPEELYPLDVDRAFAKLKPLLPDMIFWESGAQSQQLFRDGEITMGNLWHTRSNLLKQESAGKFDWTWDQQLMFASAWSVPKGNPAGKKVFDFINSSLDPEPQLALLRAMGNGPSNPKALEQMTDADKAVDPATPDNAKTAVRVNVQYYADNEAEVQNKFLDFIAS